MDCWSLLQQYPRGAKLPDTATGLRWLSSVLTPRATSCNVGALIVHAAPDVILPGKISPVYYHLCL